MGIEVDYKTSMADLALVGAELFERLRETCAEIDATRSWDAQPQHVRDGICILFAKVRNRTAVPVGHTHPVSLRPLGDERPDAQPWPLARALERRTSR